MSDGIFASKPLKPFLDRLGESVKAVSAADIDGCNFSGVAYDSRRVHSGDAFICIPGQTTDGNQYVNDAIASGASCIFTERADFGNAAPSKETPIIAVADVKQVLAEIADYLYDHPSRALRLLGVTGTNGKTTTTHLVEHMLAHAGKQVGLIGTLGARWEENGKREYQDTKHTTPQASDLQQLLRKMVERKIDTVAMEVSSHALALKRVACCDFAVACLTNITQDHLDFHKTMDHYWHSKRLLFEMLNESSSENKTAIVNADDALAGEFLSVVDKKRVRAWTYGFSDYADCAVVDAQFDFRGTKLKLKTPAGPLELSLKLNGRFNVYNTMAALLICLAEGVSLEACGRALEDFGGVPGRFEVVSGSAETDPLCVVDYAHTPDGLENVLKAARALVPADGRLIAVFGCGGDRDTSKRPQMGEIAEKLADEVMVTSDNPRTEDPEQIIADILSGIKRMRGVQVEPDRNAAINLVVGQATARDVVVVAGKGHET